jgi:hypothetical protein
LGARALEQRLCSRSLSETARPLPWPGLNKTGPCLEPRRWVLIMQFEGTREPRGARRGLAQKQRAQKPKRALAPGCCALAAAAPGEARRSAEALARLLRPGCHGALQKARRACCALAATALCRSARHRAAALWLARPSMKTRAPALLYGRAGAPVVSRLPRCSVQVQAHAAVLLRHGSCGAL